MILWSVVCFKPLSREALRVYDFALFANIICVTTSILYSVVDQVSLCFSVTTHVAINLS